MGKAHDLKLCAFLKKGYCSEILETLLIFSPFSPFLSSSCESRAVKKVDS
ncbi:hypothetical protein A0O32_0981 [Anoxybacillus flavithermus]|uniref:Uncharacterized protein n=1 Tax=Anoxybacillus flavithermus TaxID=33934 RepID=A0A178T5N0_9BACL|nr:hypothetical protein TAF16_2415 [Anoxybacillus flavithermus]OAO81949.1 hypothetical protein A0O32_0981 [Anoxybacillus flavithermus]